MKLSSLKSANGDDAIVQSIQIAAPCNVDWNSMTGDERKRFCGQCKLNVYNVESLTSREAVSLIEENEGNVCLQLYRRRDGTILTENCPVALRKLRDKARAIARTAAAILIWLGMTTNADAQQRQPFYERGKIRVTGAVQQPPVMTVPSANGVAPSQQSAQTPVQEVPPSAQGCEIPIPEPSGFNSKQLFVVLAASLLSVLGTLFMALKKRARPSVIGAVLLAIWIVSGLLLGFI